MSEKRRILTEQERDQARRVEEMRAFRAVEQHPEAVKQSAEGGLSGARENAHYSAGCQGHDPHDVDARGGNQSDARAPADGEGEARAEAPFDPAKVTVRQGENSARIEAGLSEWEEEVRADAKANGGVVPPKVSGRSLYTAVRLKNADTDVPPPSDTEALLNGLIAECRFLMHEVTFNSARLTYDPNDRILFLNSAESMAITATKVADAIGRLRNVGAPPPAPAAPQERRQRITVEHIQTVAPSPQRGEGGKGRSPESENQ